MNAPSPPTNLPVALAIALDLPEGVATEADGVAAIMALKTELATASAIGQQLRNDAAAARRIVVDAEIDAALSARKITPASVEYHRAACADAEGLDRFRAFVRGAPAIGGDA